MNTRSRQVGYFVSSQYFSDGLRITGSVLLPALVLAQVNQLQAGLAMSLGALNVSISDAPGPVLHRRNAMAVSALLSFAVTFITGFARMNQYALGAEILLFSFLFSMFAVYGNRAASVGTAALLILILMMDRPMDAAGVVKESGLVLAGSVWYSAISLLASRLQPYRLAQQVLGQCIHEIARLMAIKADFYDIRTTTDDDYRRLLTQQIAVNEKQDAVREVLFKSRRIVTESTRTGRLLLLTFVDVVDLYEQIIAMYYDYSDIRKRFGSSGVLGGIHHAILRLAAELDHIGLAVQLPVSAQKPIDITPRLDDLKRSIDALGDSEGSTLVLKKVLVSLRTVSQRIATIQKNLAMTGKDVPGQSPADNDAMEYGRFVSHQIISFTSFRNNLTFTSSVFRHAVRVSAAMLVGYVIARFLPGHHGYWVLLSISVILKPAFSLTKQRNIERISGTLLGGLIGVLILTFVPSIHVQFALMVLLMIGTYSTQRTHYIIMVIFLTPFVLILFSLLGVGHLDVAEERVFDTLLGGGISFLASYLLFPQWESGQLQAPVQAALQANVRYLCLLLDGLSGKTIVPVDYRLARKDVYVTSANLSAAFDRMLSEPKRTHRNEKLIYEFVVLNLTLSSNVATILSELLGQPPRSYPATLVRPVKRALSALTDRLPADRALPTTPPDGTLTRPTNSPVDQPDALLGEQLQYIQQISSDMGKLLERMNT